jgi:hypothetical protein
MIPTAPLLRRRLPEVTPSLWRRAVGRAAWSASPRRCERPGMRTAQPTTGCPTVSGASRRSAGVARAPMPAHPRGCVHELWRLPTSFPVSSQASSTCSPNSAQTRPASDYGDTGTVVTGTSTEPSPPLEDPPPLDGSSGTTGAAGAGAGAAGACVGWVLSLTSVWAACPGEHAVASASTTAPTAMALRADGRGTHPT